MSEENVIQIEGARTETRSLSQDLCLRIKLNQQIAARLNAEMRAATLELEILQREALDELGVDTSTHIVNLDPDRCLAQIHELQKAN